MKFNKESLAILKNFSSINPNIALTQGNFVMTRAINKTVYAEANLDDTIDTDFGIYDLPSFLSVMSLVGDEAEIHNEIAEDTLVIKNGRSKIYYPTANDSVIVKPKSRLQFPVADVIFELPATELQQLLRVSRAMAIDTIAVANNNDKIVINGYNQGVDESLTNVLYSVEVGEWEGTEDFNFLINLQNLKVLPTDYKILISSKGAIKFEAEKFTYVIALEANSTSTF